MKEIFASGLVIDLILIGTVIEAAVLHAHFRSTGRGVALADLAPNLAAGACIMLALREALRGGSWAVVAPCLAASLVAHVMDLRRRWRA